LLVIVGTTIWLGENAQRYVDETFRSARPGFRRSNCAAHQSAESSQRGVGGLHGETTLNGRWQSGFIQLPRLLTAGEMSLSTGNISTAEFQRSRHL
jgi:hypothetical protein